MAGHTAFTLKSTSNQRNNILKEDNEIRPKEDTKIRKKGDNETRSQICNFNEHMIQARSRRVTEGQGSNIGKRERNDSVTKPLGCYTWTVSRTTLMNIGK